LVISGLLARTGIVGVGTAESDLGLMLFGVGSTDEELFRDIANYKREVRNKLSLCLSHLLTTDINDHFQKAV
jgi:hypothetical protein